MTGISVGDYRDPERGLELGELMMAVAQVPGVHRVRLSSVEVIHVKDSLLEALAHEPKVCPHLHVPMQSGDDGVLAAMGRHYTAAQYLQQIATLRDAAPEVNVTTDVIVGFPTEDEAAFERTLAAVDAAAITRVHVFQYSPRPGTVAREPRRSRAAGGQAAPLPGAAGPLGGPLAPSPQRQARPRPRPCSSTRWPTHNARATRPTTRAATSRPALPPAASSSRWSASSSTRTGSNASFAGTADYPER